MPQQQDLRVLDDVTARQERQPAEHADHEQALGNISGAVQAAHEQRWEAKIHDRDKQLGKVSAIVARHGKISEALQVTDAITDPSLCAGTRAELAAIAARAGYLEQAAALASDTLGPVGEIPDRHEPMPLT